MSQSASQAAAFYREVATSDRLWTIRGAGGFPAPQNAKGQRAQPFWSSLARAEKIIQSVPAYFHFEPVAIEWPVFESRWVPGLSKDGILVGVNWSGANATGYDVEADQVATNVRHYKQSLPNQ